MLERTVVAASTENQPMADSFYGGVPNYNLLRFLRPGSRLLDIGCGSGAWAPMLRDLGVESLVGVDVSERSVRAGGERYDQVVCSPIETVNLGELGEERFDTIVAADVLEHLVDPWRELQRWRDWVTPGGELVISVPNLRDLRLMAGLAIRGRFDYSDHGGVMDRTHLRWFTAASMTDELRTAGWSVERRSGVCGPRRGRLNRLTRRRFEDVLAFQLHLAAR